MPLFCISLRVAPRSLENCLRSRSYVNGCRHRQPTKALVRSKTFTPTLGLPHSKANRSTGFPDHLEKHHALTPD
jgi:hypothetical protein